MGGFGSILSSLAGGIYPSKRYKVYVLYVCLYIYIYFFNCLGSVGYTIPILLPLPQINIHDTEKRLMTIIHYKTL